MGKTSLLQVVADFASRQGVSAHMLRGIESEAVLPFAAITDLLTFSGLILIRTDHAVCGATSCWRAVSDGSRCAG